jgi:putative transposase
MSKRKQHHPEFKAKGGVGTWMEFYNHKRPHSALGGQPSAMVY